MDMFETVVSYYLWVPRFCEITGGKETFCVFRL